MISRPNSIVSFGKIIPRDTSAEFPVEVKLGSFLRDINERKMVGVERNMGRGDTSPLALLMKDVRVAVLYGIRD